MEARVIDKTGFGVRNSVYFEAVSCREISVEDAQEAQTNLGYPIMGYDFQDFKIHRDPVLMRYKATWRCQASCD